jgi:D-alanyl-D-alanine carboxypeptidase
VLCGAGDPSLSQFAFQAAANALSDRVSAMLYKGNVSVLAVPPPGFDQDSNPGSSSVDSWEYGDLSEDYGAQPSAFVVDALLPTNVSALGERMPNSMLLQFTPGTDVGDPATVTFVSAAEAAFSEEFWRVDSTVTTSKADAIASLHYWYPLDNTKTVRLDGSVPLDAGVNAARHTIRIAAMDPTTRAEGLLAAALLGNAAVKPGNKEYTVAPVGPSARAGRLTNGLQQQCAAARAQAMQPATTIQSEPLLAILNHTLQESDNTYAELICRNQGLLSRTTDGSYETSFEAIAKTLDTLGVNRSDYIQADGSGLSRHNFVTPTALVHLLSQMDMTQLNISGVQWDGPNGGANSGGTARASPQGTAVGVSPWRELLPLAGRSGTLSDRFLGTPLEGVLRAKTGTLGGISALSGYVRRCTFSMIANNAPVSPTVLRRALDDIALAFGTDPACA